MSFSLRSNIAHSGLNWTRVPAKTLLKEIDNRSVNGREALLSLSGKYGVLKKSEVQQRTSEASSLEGYKIVCVGDFISNKMQAWNGVFGLSPYHGITSPDYAIYRFNDKCVPEFIEYLFRTSLYAADFLTRSNGIGTGFMRLNPRSLLETQIWLPKICHQSKIVEYLDCETRRVDDLIGEKERFVALLREKRVAVVSHAVTKGLEPAAPMKPSGQDWLGDVPAHWEKEKLKAHFRFTKRQGYQDLTVLSVYRDFGVIEKSSRNDNINKTPEDISSYQLVEPNDLVINKMKAWQGSMGISALRGITSPDYVVMRPIGDHISEYMHYYLRAQPLPQVYRQISNGIRTDQWRLEPEKFLDLPIFMPSEIEQRKIATFADDQTTRIDALIAETERSIALLREKRAAEITAAVTGKIDIRNAA